MANRVTPVKPPISKQSLAELIQREGARSGKLRDAVLLALDIARLKPIGIDSEYKRLREEAIAKGEEPPPITGESIQPGLRDAQKYLDWLSTHGHVKPVQRIEIAGAALDGVNQQGLSDGELQEYIALRAKLASRELPPGDAEDADFVMQNPEVNGDK